MIKTLTPPGVPIGNSRKLKLRALAKDALQQRDAPGARKAVESHIDFVKDALNNHLNSEKNETIALQ